MNEEYEKGQDITKALDAYFSQDRKFIDTARIPLICQDIRGIHGILSEIKENQNKFREQATKDMNDLSNKLDQKFVTKEGFWPIKTLVYGAVGIMLTGLLTALIYLIIK